MLILRISQKLLNIDRWRNEYVIKGRPKSIYSIRREIKKKRSFDEVYDKYFRIVYKSTHTEEKFAWKIYSIVNDHYRPSPSRLRNEYHHQNLLAMKPTYMIMAQRDDGLKSKFKWTWTKLWRKEL
jgi:hypothetical protein